MVQLKPGVLHGFSSSQDSWVQLKPGVLGSAQARGPEFSSNQGSWVQLKPGVLGSAQTKGSWVQLKPGVLGPGILGSAQARDQLWAQLKPEVCWLITLPYIIKYIHFWWVASSAIWQINFKGMYILLENFGGRGGGDST